MARHRRAGSVSDKKWHAISAPAACLAKKGTPSARRQRVWQKKTRRRRAGSVSDKKRHAISAPAACLAKKGTPSARRQRVWRKKHAIDAPAACRAEKGSRAQGPAACRAENGRPPQGRAARRAEMDARCRRRRCVVREMEAGATACSLGWTDSGRDSAILHRCVSVQMPRATESRVQAAALDHGQAAPR
jgi:hypothetical protein